MDCSKTEVFFKEWRRMCEYRTKHHTIDECPLRTKENCQRCYRINAIYFASSGEFEEVQKIVQEWSDEHPIKTRLSVLKEHYPNARMAPNGAPHACVRNLYGIECPYKGKDINDEFCLQCWNTPIEDGAQIWKSV